MMTLKRKQNKIMKSLSLSFKLGASNKKYNLDGEIESPVSLNGYCCTLHLGWGGRSPGIGLKSISPLVKCTLAFFIFTGALFKED